MTDDTICKFLPLTLSVETLSGRAASLVRRGTPLPTQRTQRFSTTVDKQTTVSVEVYFGFSSELDRSGFARRKVIHSADVGPSLTYAA